jgi:serine phosphatase RsbU (regulator of sigma subunit)
VRRLASALLYLPLLLIPTSRGACAQTVLSTPVVRYRFGDDARWATPEFDDTEWAKAEQTQVLLPGFTSDGFVWARMRVAIPKNAGEPLAIRLQIGGTRPGAADVYVNGRAVGAEGGFPPDGAPVYLPPSAVFDLPPGTAAPGSTALVAFRAWYMPRSRPMAAAWSGTAVSLEESSSPFRTSLDLMIGSGATLRALDRADRLSGLLGSMPDLALNTLLGLAGLGLIVFWRWTRRAELAWCSALLISYPIYACFFVATDHGYLSVRYQNWGLLFVLLTFPTMLITVEFIRTVHGLPGGVWRWAAHGCWILFNAGTLAGDLARHPSAGTHAALALATWSVQLFNLITIGANLWVLLVRRYNRVIAATMTTIPLASALAHFGFREHWVVGYTDISFFDIGSVVSGFAIAAMLVQRAVAAWKQTQQLQVEFEAAREVQERLVTAPPTLPGFRIESVYRPAAHVGGDFYAIRSLDDGGAQIVFGDVSGKGLRAAMTVSAIVGALRAMPALTPSRVLADLNRSLAGSLDHGFVTCCVTRIAADGHMTIANAGHLAPYCNGDEYKCDSGLPLGLDPDAAWPESTFSLAPGDTLTFLSDGVVEATSPTGELFGFDRTRQISTQSAEQIAHAAQQFGQLDDITVLTLFRISESAAPPRSSMLKSIAGFVCLLLLQIGAFHPALSQSAPQSAPQSIVLGQSAVPLNGPWKFAPGDSPWAAGSPLWAQPSFDDAHWGSLDLTPAANSNDVQFGGIPYTPGWTSRGYPNLRRYAWYRLRIYPESNGQPLWIELPVDVDDGYEVYANGQFLGQFGDLRPHHIRLHYGRPVALPLPVPGPDGSVEIALRFYMSDVSPLRWPDAGGLHAPPLLGIASTIALESSHEAAVIRDGESGDFVALFLCLLALPLALWGALRNRQDRSWRWLALALFCDFAGVSAQTLGNLDSHLSMWCGEFWGICIFLIALEFCWTLFWWHWFGLQNRRWIPRAAAVLSILYLLTTLCFESPLLGFTFAGQSLLHACSTAIVYLCSALGMLLFVILIQGARKDRTAALLAAAPILLLEFSSFYVPLLVAFHFSPHFYIGTIGFQYPALAAICQILIVGALSIRRFLLSRDCEIIERESIARDLEQARQLQQSVLVAEGIRVPACSVDVVYHPAQTVGGDFFLTTVQPDGAILLLIGDVSGKGVSAAMLVAVLVGAARARARQTSDPAAILVELNTQLNGRSGDHFATCLAAALTPDGILHLANAGHLPPYRNGVEIEIPGSLPLGMTEALNPALHELTLQPGDTLMFLSDGVVEAQSPAGELFGFERTRQISTQSAAQIARAASTHGQQDDITVLTLAFAGQEVAHV